MFTVVVDKRIEQFLDRLSIGDKARVDRTIQLFKDKGFLLDARYLKKLSKLIWELRPGRIRLLLGIVSNEVIIVNVFMKKTQKTPKKEIDLAITRLRRYL